MSSHCYVAQVQRLVYLADNKPIWFLYDLYIPASEDYEDHFFRFLDEHPDISLTNTDQLLELGLIEVGNIWMLDQ